MPASSPAPSEEYDDGDDFRSDDEYDGHDDDEYDEDDDVRDDTERRGGPRLGPARAARAAMQQIAELTGKTTEGVTAVSPAEDGWMVRVEVVEDRRIPSSADVLAVYEAEIDAEGELESYRRAGRYSRGRGDGGGGS